MAKLVRLAGLVGFLASAASPSSGADPPAVAIGYCTNDLARAKAVGFDYAELAAVVSPACPKPSSRRSQPRTARGLVAVEPQRKEETNIINSAAEGLDLVLRIGHPAFQLMVDFYHLASEHEDPAILLGAASHVRHIHFANPGGRVFPREAGEYDYAAFFANLRGIGYRGGLSIEARTGELERDAPRAIEFLRVALKEPLSSPRSTGSAP